MTIKVTIEHSDLTINKDIQVRYIDLIGTQLMSPTYYLKPGDKKEFWVWAQQRIVVEEVND